MPDEDKYVSLTEMERLNRRQRFFNLAMEAFLVCIEAEELQDFIRTLENNIEMYALLESRDSISQYYTLTESQQRNIARHKSHVTLLKELQALHKHYNNPDYEIPRNPRRTRPG